MKLALLLLAAGRGTRFGGPVPKAYLPLRRQPLLVHSARRLHAAAARAGVDAQLIVTVHPDDRPGLLPDVAKQLADLAPVFVDGGATRQQSMTAALATLAPDVDLVLIHDAARPLFPVAAAADCIRQASTVGAALLAVPVPDTLKRVRDGRITDTVDRTGIWLAQTPQVIRRELLTAALAKAAGDAYEGTDDVSLVEHLGGEVTVVLGAATNLKITRPEDLALAEALLALETP
ncbi:MAG: 2-C-methyl-D-erythritol 4-phosphate cytidylyltransferase [Planctomycetes bacterium]|nr:2-C-methyl-D-erythritol 4-phosphate cytidylyltransferase [Planctomycetota bacterium]